MHFFAAPLHVRYPVSRVVHAAEVDSDSDEAEVEEEEPVESDAARRKREQGRAAFLRLLRMLLALVPLVMVLSQQPFVIKPRAPGVNRGKVRAVLSARAPS
eukprot:3922391-Pleurochrysis_carterae.AAC.2